ITFAALDLPFVLGVIVAAMVGYWAIHFLLQYLRQGSYLVFAIYRLALALVVLIAVWLR
ncbi:MAG TPA: UDP-diphosphatase, partial [Firmicutes bacterium]|nr:UDP-diphosphatase [Bacillota bacterium]